MEIPWLTLLGVLLGGLGVVAGAWLVSRSRMPQLAGVKAPPRRDVPIADDDLAEFQNGLLLDVQLPKTRLSGDKSGRILVRPCQLIVVDCAIDSERLLWPLLVQAKVTAGGLAVVATSWNDLVVETLAANANAGVSRIVPLIGGTQIAADLEIDITSAADLMAGYLPKPAHLAALLVGPNECRYLPLG